MSEKEKLEKVHMFSYFIDESLVHLASEGGRINKGTV